jgi:hypothetical protein
MVSRQLFPGAMKPGGVRVASKISAICRVRQGRGVQQIKQEHTEIRGQGKARRGVAMPQDGNVKLMWQVATVTVACGIQFQYQGMKYRAGL